MTSSRLFQLFSKFTAPLVVMILVILHLTNSFQKLNLILQQGHFTIQSFLKPDPRVIQNASRTVNINQLLPPLESLLLINAGTFLPDPTAVDPQRKYYKKIVEYNPSTPEAYVLLGFCDYYSGREEEAIQAFQKTVQLNPYFFFAHYNLGVLYARKGNFKEAYVAFERSLAFSGELTLRVVMTSKMYQQILFKKNLSQKQITDSLKFAYQDSLRGLQLSQQALTHPEQRSQIQKNFIPKLKFL